MKLEKIEKAILVWGPVSDEGIAKIRQLGWLAVVAECRPGMIGLRHNVNKLKKAGVSCVYCNDNTIGLLLAKGKIYKTIVFYKSKNEQGITAYCGTLYAVLLSRLHKVGVELMPQPENLPDLSGSVESLGGKKFVIANNAKEHIIEAADEKIEMELLI